MENKRVPPSQADYRALLDDCYENLRAFANREIDSDAFRHRVNELEAHSRALNLLAKFHRMCEKAEAEGKKSSQPPASS